MTKKFTKEEQEKALIGAVGMKNTPLMYHLIELGAGNLMETIHEMAKLGRRTMFGDLIQYCGLSKFSESDITEILCYLAIYGRSKTFADFLKHIKSEFIKVDTEIIGIILAIKFDEKLIGILKNEPEINPDMKIFMNAKKTTKDAIEYHSSRINRIHNPMKLSKQMMITPPNKLLIKILTIMGINSNDKISLVQLMETGDIDVMFQILSSDNEEMIRSVIDRSDIDKLLIDVIDAGKHSSLIQICQFIKKSPMKIKQETIKSILYYLTLKGDFATIPIIRKIIIKDVKHVQ